MDTSQNISSSGEKISNGEKVEFHYEGEPISVFLPEGTGNVARIIRKGRFYERKFLEYISQLQLEGVYIDVGANIGNHSIYFGLFSNADKVIGFEPHPQIFRLLQKNIRANDLEERVQPYNVALGEEEGTCSLATVPSDEIGGSKVVEGDELDQWTLDRFADEEISLVKIDVEGFEKFVLQGGEAVLENHRPELFMELTSWRQYYDVFKLLSPLGYTPIAVFNNSATYHFSTTLKADWWHTLSRIPPVRWIFFRS